MSSDSQSAGPKPEDLQFDQADFVQPSSQASTCDVCGRSLTGSYFEVNEKMTCEGCRYEAEAAFNQRGGAGAFLKAALAGSGAALAGSILYYAVREATGYEFGLIAILVGFAVGYAVRWGSRSKGGWAYQSLAIFLTYMAIVSTYIPLIFAEAQKQAQQEKPAATAPAPASGEVRPVTASAATGTPTPAAEGGEEELTLGGAVLGIGALFLFIMAIPFLAGFENLIGIAIIAFGLYEAWKLNRRTTLSISGPFTLGAAPALPPTNP